MNLDKACLHIASELQGTKNYPFLAGAEGEGFKNLLFPFVYMKEVLKEFGIDLSTRDINTTKESFLLFAWDNPHTIAAKKRDGQIWSLIMQEPPVYAPETWDKHYHDKFDYVFTFDETLVDNKKYFYYSFAVDTEYFSIPEIVSEEVYKRRTLAVNVSNAVQRQIDPDYPNCTHYRRYKTIKWYGRHYPHDFGFYGGTFRKRDYYFQYRGARLVRQLVPSDIYRRIAAYLQRDLINVFRGELKPLEKFDVIKNYNFYYCYENSTDINGYISEKIFDCFYNGLVPIYWGAPNIGELIPYNCYIDGSKYESEEELYSFIKTMKYDQYRSYLEEANRFLLSQEMDRFTVKSSVGNILTPLMKHIRGRYTSGLG